MKNVLRTLLLFTLIILPNLLPAQVSAEGQETIDIHYFMDDFCLNCQEVSNYLDEVDFSIYDVNIIEYDVSIAENQALFSETVNTFDVPLNYPLMVIGGTILQGTVEIKSELIEVIEYYQGQETYVDVVEQLINDETVMDEDIIGNPNDYINIPLIGEINRRSFSLLIGAIFIGLIDGFNPCAMWVLVFLITMLINLKDRKRIWILGSFFILTSGVVYYVIMMAWLQVAVAVIWHNVFRTIIGMIAILFSYFSFKHFWRARQQDIGCEVTDEKQRSKLMERIKNVIHKHHLGLAIVGIIGVALTVNILELACSAGLPVIYTSMLAYQGVSQFQSAMYILLYVFFFMLDDLIIFAIAMITFKVTGISNRYAKYSNLIGGLIMLFIGLALIFFPNLLF